MRVGMVVARNTAKPYASNIAQNDTGNVQFNPAHLLDHSELGKFFQGAPTSLPRHIVV